MKKLITPGLMFLGLIFLICSCQSKIEHNYPQNPENIRKQRAGKFFDNINFFSANKTKTIPPKPTKNPLWLASIEIVSSLLPIDVIDENSGLIITKWYQDGQNQNSRIRINLLVKGFEPKKENLDLTIFKQHKDKKDLWVDDKSSDQSIPVQIIKDKIITKTQSK